MAELTARRDHWTDVLPESWRHNMNTNPFLNALGQALNRKTPDLGEAAMRQYGTPEQQEKADQDWLMQKVHGPKLNPLAAEMLDKGGMLANFLGPGVKLPAAAPKPTGIRAYHGSPHDFDRFDISKIGTGEGAQAYGRGLYFAENEGVARSYRDNLSADRAWKDKAIRDAEPRLAQALIERGYPDDLAASVAQTVRLEHVMNTPESSLARLYGNKGAEFNRALADAWAVKNDVLGGPPGRMYEVNIKADPDQFLDWDKPLSQQPEARAILERIRVNTAPEAPHDNPAVNNIRAGLAQANMRRDDWQDALKRPETVEALRDAGIPGIKYLDQGSRTAGQGSRNFVVFDENLIEILRKYGLLPPVAAGTAAALNQQEPQQ